MLGPSVPLADSARRYQVADLLTSEEIGRGDKVAHTGPNRIPTRELS